MTHEAVPTDPNTVLHVEALVAAHPEIAGLRNYEYFRTEATEIGQPALKYPDLTRESVEALKQPMEQALDQVRRQIDDPKTEALFDAIEFRYSELFLMGMARVMNDKSIPDAERAEARDWFKLASENLYGAPNKETFDGLARKNVLARTEPQPGDDERTAALRRELAERIGTIDPTEYSPFAPNAETLQRMHDLIHERYDELVDHIEDDREYDVGAMIEVFRVMLDKLGATEMGWRAEITANSANLGVAAHQRLVEVGERKKALKGSVLKARGVHEAGVHVERSLRAERAGWAAAAYGMNGYVGFEEPLSEAFESAWNGKFASTGEMYQVIAGLTYGFDNHAPRNFPEVYDIMWRTNALKPANLPVTDESIAKAQKLAHNQCVRMFRGTDMLTPGINYLKDLSYFGGQQAAWNVLSKVETQDDLDLVLSGKVDLTRPDHRRIAEAIAKDNAT